MTDNTGQRSGTARYPRRSRRSGWSDPQNWLERDVAAVRDSQGGLWADLRREADDVARKEAAAIAQRERFERLVARSVSAVPTSTDWFDHPGALPRREVMEAGRLHTVQLHRIMARYRRAAGLLR